MTDPINNTIRASNAPQGGAQVLLTGVTGFVGKVVLAGLMRRKAELGVAGVTVIVRNKKSRDGKIEEPKARFASKVATSAIFSGLPSNWIDSVYVVAGDLEQPQCGLAAADSAATRARITHVIHCAASVEFDLPIRDAAAANITSALNVLELARSCPKLVGMVDTSTAYVTPHREGPIGEELAHLPFAAGELYQGILDGTLEEKELLAQTGHANTYTYTKCIAEHLLCERRGDVPLAIVRPSVISAAWRDPVPGWIDSPAALAGALLYAAMGVIPSFQADPGVRLDTIPVDVVSRVIINSAFLKPFATPGGDVPIRYAASGLLHAIRTDLVVAKLKEYFNGRMGGDKLQKMHLGTVAHGHESIDLNQRSLVNETLKIGLKLLGKQRDYKRLAKMNDKVAYLNQTFKYFTHGTFEFVSAEPAMPADATPAAYMEVICRGLYHNILKKDDSEVCLAGSEQETPGSDLKWAMSKPDGNWAIRTMGIGMRKVLRRCTSSVTWDRASFEHAVASAAPDSIFILAPSHRSYFDFLLTSYVCFQHPELGIPVPHIAAADDFSRIPVVGKLLEQSKAFYIPRGVGQEVRQVNSQLEKLAKQDGSLMFFVEGQRSRSRLTLAPKRGLLRGLQATGRSFTILPIAVSFDRLPEEGALEKELLGTDKPKMSLGAIVKWLGELAKNRVQLGRVHISCGEPLVMDADTDVRTLSERIVGEQQENTVATRFHLRTFLSTTGLGAAGLTEEWLAGEIERRGGRVLASPLPAASPCSATLDQSLRNQWIHWFFGDAKAFYPDDSIIDHYIARHSWSAVPTVVPSTDSRLRRVVDALFAPIRADYMLVGRLLRDQKDNNAEFSARSIVRAHPTTHFPVVEDALQFFAESGATESSAVSTTAKSGAGLLGNAQNQNGQPATQVATRP